MYRVFPIFNVITHWLNYLRYFPLIHLPLLYTNVKYTRINSKCQKVGACLCIYFVVALSIKYIKVILHTMYVSLLNRKTFIYQLLSTWIARFTSTNNYSVTAHVLVLIVQCYYLFYSIFQIFGWYNISFWYA